MNLIKQGKNDQEKILMFQKFYTALLKNTVSIRFDTKLDRSDKDQHIWNVKIFTDNVVLGSPFSKALMHHESLTGSIIGDIIDLQLGLILDGYFFRGGWSHGLLYMDELTVSGEALLKAYELEARANFPRIIIDKDIAALITEEHLKYYASPELSPQYRRILLDQTEEYFLNYLYPLVEHEDGPFFDELRKHKNLIDSNLKLNAGVPKILAKYQWSADYHNFFCREFIHDCPVDCFFSQDFGNTFKPIV